MVGGQAIGARARIEGIVRVTDLLGSEMARESAVPAIDAPVTIRLTDYFVCELPNSIARTVGREFGCRTRWARGEGGEGDEECVEDRFVGFDG